MAKVDFKKNKNGGYNVSFSKLTAGEILSIRNALGVYAPFSPVADDVKSYFENGVHECADEPLKSLLTE